MIDAKQVLALIPARGGSRRLPGKNLRPFAGRPLIAWTIEAAREAHCIDRLILSSEDQAIIAEARTHGCDAPFVRPPDLSTDAAASMDVVLHAIDAVGQEFDYLVLLQPTSPLRTSGDIEACLAICHETGAASCVSMGPLPKPPNYFGRRDSRGVFAAHDYFTGPDEPGILNGAVYVARIDHLRRARTFYDASTRAYVMPVHRSIDIDDEEEFVMAEALMEARLICMPGNLRPLPG